MNVDIVLPQELDIYFAAVLYFLGGYWLAYAFKNLSNLLEHFGIITFVLIMVFFWSMIITLGNYISDLQDYLFTAAYGLGFFLRFFRHDY